jgi:uncharacterized membrane protein
MDPSQLALYSLTRILHVGTAIVLVGGTFFVWFVLQPAATLTLSDADHARLRGSIVQTWKRVVHLGIALLLVSGGINYYRVLADASHKGDGLYHALLGTKMLLALAIFFVASALVGRSAKFEAMRQNSRKWLALNLCLALAIVAISGFLKVRGLPG